MVTRRRHQQKLRCRATVAHTSDALKLSPTLMTTAKTRQETNTKIKDEILAKALPKEKSLLATSTLKNSNQIS